jgi:16S rRNA (cytidine1402-2'-O)-methyltransferase
MLTLVPTPLGNLGDMAPRAIQALKDAAMIYCEDTRRTRILTSYFGISTPLKRYDERNPKSLRELMENLKSGKFVALVSDSGLPGISDPGHKAAAMARREKINVTAIPGPSAVVAALAASGLPADSFIFLGFLPRAEGKRKRIIEAVAAFQRTIAIYESPFRVKALMRTLLAALSPMAQCSIVRELSKMHEEWFFGTLTEVEKTLNSRETILGEFVVMIHPHATPGEAHSNALER